MAALVRALALFAALIALCPSYADDASPSLLDFELKDLREPEFHSLRRYEGKPVVLLFFQPDCNWCLRQVKSINELDRRCPGGFSAVAIGVRGNRAELRKELHRLKPDFPAYQASPRLIESLGGVETTPLILLGDTGGEFVNWMRGYAPTDELQAFIGTAGELTCR